MQLLCAAGRAAAAGVLACHDLDGLLVDLVGETAELGIRSLVFQIPSLRCIFLLQWSKTETW